MKIITYDTNGHEKKAITTMKFSIELPDGSQLHIDQQGEDSIIVSGDTLLLTPVSSNEIQVQAF